MAAAYEEFLKRIQEGLKKEEEEEGSQKAAATTPSSSSPLPSSTSASSPSAASSSTSPKSQDGCPYLSREPPPRDSHLAATVVPQHHHPFQQQKDHTRTSSLKDLYEDICQNIRSAGTLDTIMQDFQECKTDLDRVTYVSQLTELENLSLEESYAQKNQDDASNYEKVYDLLVPNEASALKALDVMKKCIQKTPPDETKSLAVRYMKRGWAFLLLEQFGWAAMDAKKSLSFGCPEELLWNSYEILGHANAQQKEYKKSEGYFLKALENLRKSNIVNEVKATVTVRIMTVFKTIKSKKSKKKNSGENDNTKDTVKFPQLSYGVHKSFPSASAALDFVGTSNHGRCVIAKRDIKPGDVLMVDSPYSSMLNPDYLDTHCFHCYKRAPVPVPCNSCSKVWYCCEGCRESSWNGTHAVECRVLNHLIEPGIGKMALLSFRMLTLMTWSKLQTIRGKIESLVESELQELTTPQEEEEGKEKEESTTTPFKPMSWEGQYLPHDYMTVLHLTTNSTKRTFGDLFKRSVTAMYLAKCLKLSGYFGPGDLSEDDLLFAASVLLRYLQGSSCNAYEISEFELGPSGVVGSKVLEVGGAIYTTISLTNHACFSNTSRYSVGDKCVLRAIRSIPKGSEIFDNYGFHYYMNTVNERQEILLNQYKFKCMCEPCRDLWSLYPHHPTETLIFRCPAPECGQSCCYSNTSRSKCNLCGNQQQYTKLLKELDTQLTRFKEALTKLKQGHAEAALPLLASHMEFLDRHAVLPIKHYSDLQEALKQCFNYLGNLHNPNETVIPEPQQRHIKLKAGKNKFVSPNQK